MTNLEHIRTVIVLTATGVSLWAAFYFVYIPSTISAFREGVFAERHKLFALVADGRIDPSHPAYVRTRSMCNGLIRFADRLEFTRVFLMGWAIRRGGGGSHDDWNSTTSALEPEVRKELDRVRTAVAKKAFFLGFARSPFWLAIGVAVVTAVAAFALITELVSFFVRRPLNRHVDRIRGDFEAYHLRLAETAAQEEEALRPCAA